MEVVGRILDSPSSLDAAIARAALYEPEIMLYGGQQSAAGLLSPRL